MDNWCRYCKYVMEYTFAQMGGPIVCRKYDKELNRHGAGTYDDVPMFERAEECIRENGKEDSPNVGYNNHGCISDWSEVRDIEVNDRENYSEEEVEYWEKKYSLRDDSKVIWLTRHIEIAMSYDIPGDEYDAFMELPMSDIDKAIEEDRTIVPFVFGIGAFNRIDESYDGDGGHLYVLKSGDELR